jgi:N-acetylneuraminic acid mutarotase
MSDFTGTPVQGPAAIVLGTRAIIVSGTDGTRLVAQAYQFDTSNRTWTRKGDFPGPARADASGFAIGGRGYMASGWSENDVVLKDVWEYEPSQDSWTRKQDFPGEARILPTTLVIGAKVFVIGGGRGSTRHRDVWEFDPAANTWTRKGDFPGEAFMSAPGFVLGTRGYLGTGSLGGASWTTTKAFWEYNPSTDTWTRKADFPGVARGFALGFSLGNRGYLGLGVQTTQLPMNVPVDFWAYDPGTDTWARQTDLPASGRGMAVGFAIGSEGFIGLGNDANVNSLRDFWRFIPN